MSLFTPINPFQLARKRPEMFFPGTPDAIACAHHLVAEVLALAAPDVTVERHGDFVLIEVTANAFLHHMVRNIAGLLIAIGQGEKDPDWARSVLASKDRTQSGPTACAEGLYLWFVRYPRAFELPPTRSVMINPLR